MCVFVCACSCVFEVILWTNKLWLFNSSANTSRRAPGNSSCFKISDFGRAGSATGRDTSERRGREIIHSDTAHTNNNPSKSSSSAILAFLLWLQIKLNSVSVG